MLYFRRGAASFKKGLLCTVLLMALGGGMSLAAPDLASSRGAHMPPADSLCNPDLVSQATAGAEAVRSGNVDRGLSGLRQVVEADPGCYLPERGAAAYWLGRAEGKREEYEAQVQAWRKGIDALRNSPAPTDPRLIDAFLGVIFRQERHRHYDRATQAYYSLLSETGKERQEWAARPVAHHLRLVAHLVPSAFRTQYGLSRTLGADSVGAVKADLGPRIIAWWRGQDPLPQTIANERVERHLSRVVHARENYEHDGYLDDRGFVYVRLGEPTRKTTIQFNSIDFADNVLSGSSRWMDSDFKQGKFWVYDHISRSTEYLFVEVNRDVFKSGTVLSMLPSSARRSFSSSSRGAEEAEVFVRAMKEAYSQLAVYSSRYHSQHQTFANYVMDLEATAGAPRPERNWSSQSIARRMLPQVREENRYQRRLRKKHTPPSYSGIEEDWSSLPVSVRHTRFLESDGDTRVEIAWSIPSSGLVTKEGQEAYFLATTLLHRGPEGERRASRYQSSRFRRTEISGGGFIKPQTTNVRVRSSGPFRIDMQWDQFAAGRGDTPKPEKRVARMVEVDTLRALESNPSTLTVSDLQPMLVPNVEKETGPWEQGMPYPFETVTFESPLALYFEVYHLTLDPSKKTRYTVEYVVQESSDASVTADAWAKRGTAVRTTMSGTNRTANEYILLDLQEWDVEGERITVSVRVTDEHTGQKVVRTLDFRVRPEIQR